MIIKKLLESYIDIHTEDMFSSDQDAMLLDKLSKKFVGVCYSSCYVLKVNKIIRRGYIYMGSAVSVKFEVDALVYYTNEIVNGCKIIKKEKHGIIHAKSKYAGVNIRIRPDNSIYKEGDVVPVIIKGVRYNTNQNAISVSAVPFMPIIDPNSFNYYKINKVLDKQQLVNLTDLLKQIRDAESGLSKTNRKIYKFFVDILSHKLKSTKMKKIDIDKMLELKVGDLVYNPTDKYDELNVYYEEGSSAKSDMEIITEEKLDELKALKYTTDVNIITSNTIDESMYIIVHSILMRKLLHLQTLHNFLEHYTSIGDIQKNKNTWKLYNMLKKDL
jgi:hypothetical protein